MMQPEMTIEYLEQAFLRQCGTTAGPASPQIQQIRTKHSKILPFQHLHTEAASARFVVICWESMQTILHTPTKLESLIGKGCLGQTALAWRQWLCITLGMVLQK